MTTQRTSTLRSAVSLLSARWIATQIGLALLIVLALAGGGEAWLLLRMSGRPPLCTRVGVGAIVILLGAALAFAWGALLDHVAISDSLWAGYLNSRASHGMRNLLSYQHIYQGLVWLWDLLRWAGYYVIAVTAVALTISDRPVSASKGALRTVVCCLGVFVGFVVLTLANGWLTDWTPGHGLAVESISLLLRMALLLLLDGLVASTMIALLVAAVRRYETPVGTPEDNQPLTVVTP
jgi:hypothetical protein